jgi:hypothetical protein
MISSYGVSILFVVGLLWILIRGPFGPTDRRLQNKGGRKYYCFIVLASRFRGWAQSPTQKQGEIGPQRRQTILRKLNGRNERDLQTANPRSQTRIRIGENR